MPSDIGAEFSDDHFDVVDIRLRYVMMFEQGASDLPDHRDAGMVFGYFQNDPGTQIAVLSSLALDCKKGKEQKI